MARQLVELFFQPPLAIARLGGSETPMESFTWQPSRDAHGDNRTTIKPAPTLQVDKENHTVDAILPDKIVFKDNGEIRPVAPFFELWARFAGDDEGEPLTIKVLKEMEVELTSIRYRIDVANRKAQRRCNDAACAFVASADFPASDHNPHELKALSPVCPGDTPLVTPGHEIPLGSIQAIKPTDGLKEFDVDGKEIKIDRSMLRIRFTPAAGKVYGPKNIAPKAPASPLPPGSSLDPSTHGGRLHEIVPEENRTLGENTTWSKYKMDTLPAAPASGQAPSPGAAAQTATLQQDPQPSDSYDGANVGTNVSWGVVDDSCDGVIQAELVSAGQRFVATARVVSTCPDFSPDRRPFYSLTDDLADRDLPDCNRPLTPAVGAERDALAQEVAELFQRVFETAAMVNLDAIRNRAIDNNFAEFPPTPISPTGWPQVDNGAMTKDDKPFADIVPPLLPDEPSETATPGTSRVPLRFTPIVRTAHGKLADKDFLLDFLASRGDRVRALLRPPYARFAELPAVQIDPPLPGTPGQPLPATGFRDARVDRDTMHDMRMPPFMRDSDATPLSVTRRQYDMIMRLLAS